MNRLFLFIQGLLLLSPIPLYAHDDPTHATESALYQIFHPEHLLLYGIPTLTVCALIYKNRKKLLSYLSTKKEKNISVNQDYP